MNNQIKIITYHYVRPIKGTKYDEIKKYAEEKGIVEYDDRKL